MTVSPDVNFEELARSTDEFNGAQLKAVCVEAGMIALREGATKLNHEHFLSGISEGEFPLLCATFSPVLMENDSAKQEEEQTQLFHVVCSGICHRALNASHIPFVVRRGALGDLRACSRRSIAFD